MTVTKKPNIFNQWHGGLNRIQTPMPRTCYRTGKNIRLTETYIPERRTGTTKKNTNVACDLAATDKPILNALKYYPTGQTAQWVVGADESAGANSDIFFSDDGTNFTAQSQSLTAGATPYFAVFPITGVGDEDIQDHLMMVNGNESMQYDPNGDGWEDMTGVGGGQCISGGTHICVHGNRAWVFKNNYAYWSSVAGATIAWNNSTQYLDFAHQGEVIQCGVSFNGDLIVLRRNAIGVLRGKDPYSGVQINALEDTVGIAAIKTLVAGKYLGRPALYYLSDTGLQAFNGYYSAAIDEPVRMDIIGLMNTTYITGACAALYGNRYLMVSFPSTTSTVNDTTVIYDTLRNVFISKDEGYYPNCYFHLKGGTDKGELYFGTSKSLGLIYQFGSGTDDDSPATDGTDVNIDCSFGTSVINSGSATQKTKVRTINVSMDTSAEASYKVTLSAEDGRYTTEQVVSDERSVTVHQWGDTGLKWGQEGLVWGSGQSDQRTIFGVHVPSSFINPYSYQVQVDMEDQDKTYRIQQIEPLERPRTLN
ncbi:MAG: hypothetical protein C4542_04380 [Dehalococcoidia bacterium]|nr:MAG: hypothetical protein C4542_04380 [Dehalococcoidia bacterium]